MASIMSSFLGIQSQFKVLHWQTSSYAKHMAYGATYDTLDPLIDAFMETYMGKYGRVALEGEKDIIALTNVGEMNVNEYLDVVCNMLMSLSEILDDRKDTDLLNIKDEMVAAINKLKYLLTLK